MSEKRIEKRLSFKNTLDFMVLYEGVEVYYFIHLHKL